MPSARVDRVVADRAVPPVVPVAERATTRRVPDVLRFDDVPMRADVVVPARADVVWGVRVATVRVDVDGVADRADVAVAVVPARADVVPRCTTRRVVVPGALVRVNTLIWAFDCPGVTPGFRFVRMVLFIYGYRLLYVFSLT